MTVKTYYKQNGVENLPILNCEDTHYRMTNEELRKKIFLGDAMINIGYLKEIRDELTELFREFCRENGFSTRKILYLQYAGKFPKEDEVPEEHKRNIVQN